MKILFLSRQLNIGGAERQLVTLANELAARGHEIVIASYYPGGALSKMLDPKRIKLISYEKKSRWDLFTLFFKTLKVVRDEQPTILHGWMHTQNVVATFAKALNPKVTMVWAVRASNLEEHLDWAEKLTIWLQARLSGFATRIAVNSMAGLEYAAKGGLPREKMMFVPNGIDTNTFYPNDEERRRVRAQWNMGDDVKIVGNISRFDPIKNHKMFLKAAAAVAAERSDVRFVCVGHGKESYLQELKQLSRTLGPRRQSSLDSGTVRRTRRLQRARCVLLFVAHRRFSERDRRSDGLRPSLRRHQRRRFGAGRWRHRSRRTVGQRESYVGGFVGSAQRREKRSTCARASESWKISRSRTSATKANTFCTRLSNNRIRILGTPKK